MLNFAGLKKLWAWFAGGSLVVTSLFLLAHPAYAAPTATAGEIQGGKYTVDVAGTKIELQADNTTVTTTPSSGTTSVRDGKITITGVLPGTYSVKVDFKFKKDACTKNWFTRLATATSPILAAFCANTAVADTYYSSTKTFDNVVVSANKITYLEGSDATAARSLGSAVEVNEDGTPVIDCSGKGIIMTWIVCPTLEFLFGTIDFIFQNMIQPFLSVNPITITDASGKETVLYTIWNNIRNIANIIFIFAFFAIILSQATSAGITNYGIKRLLPRLILVVIATNLSFFICAVLIDIFNVFGAGLASLILTTVINGQPSIDLSVGGLGTISQLADIMGVLPAATAAVIFAVLVFFLFALMVVMVVVATLIIRQVLLIFLIIGAPIAFVAGLLPNTQSLFRRWGDTFIRLLAMYPIIMLLFAASKIASTILSQVGGIAG